MHITILTIGKLKESYWTAAVEEYAKRLRPYCQLTIVERKEARLPDKASPAEEANCIQEEGKSLLQALSPDTYVIALAIAGKSMSSPALADHLQKLALAGKSHITFIIGGSLGLSQEVLSRADLQLSFSAMTFPHQMMRVILLEQIYRSFKIIHHETYHK